MKTQLIIISSLYVTINAQRIEYKSIHSTQVSLKGQPCNTDTALCVNNELRTDEFQPATIPKERSDIEAGLICHEALCKTRFADGASCTEHDQCKSRQCYSLSATESSSKTCVKEFSIQRDNFCPNKTDPRHNLCEDGFFCSPENTCVSYANVGEPCTAYFTSPSSSPVDLPPQFISDTCNPLHQIIYCQPSNLNASDPSTFLTNSLPGVCVDLVEREEGESCGVHASAPWIPLKCEYDLFCFNKLDGSTPVCTKQEKDGKPCFVNEQCRFGHLCNKERQPHIDVSSNGTQTYTEGVCRKVLDAKLGTVVSDGALCEEPYTRDLTTSECSDLLTDKTCTSEEDCFTGTDTKMSTFYCNIAANTTTGVCKSWVPDACEEAYEDYLKYALRSNMGGYIKNTVSCTDAGCFSLRVVYSQMKKKARSLHCCIVREVDDENSPLRVGASDVYYVPNLQGLLLGEWEYVEFIGEQEGDICPPLGVSSATYGAVFAIIGFLLLVVVFVVVMECVIHKPEEATSEEKKQKPNEPVS